MSADRTDILTEIAGLLRPLTDSLLPGEEITMETRFGADLGLESLALANLSGRLQARFGPAANVVPFLAGRDPGPISEIRVGELVDYIAGVLDQVGTQNGTALASYGRTDAEQQASDLFISAMLDEESPLDEPDRPADRTSARNENEAVLSEIAPGATRSVLQFPRGQVEVFTAGDGPSLVLMHPINVGAGVFARQFASLADRYRVICMHNPGVGATTWQADPTLSGIARLYRTVLTELSVPPPFHVMGNSFGGLIAQEFALQHPTECASLALIDCSYRAGARGGGPRPLSAIIREEFDQMYDAGRTGQVPADSRADLEELLLRCESMEPAAGVLYLDGLKYLPSMYSRLPQIAAPTLIVRGELDTMVPAEDPQLLLKAIPDARFEELANAGHFPCLTHPAEVDALITPFLATHARQRSRASAAVVSEPAAAAGQPAAAGPDVGRCIIIGTGRCGSTMLSDLITQESESLSVSESLSPIRGRLLVQPLNEFTGAQYWSMLSQPGQQHGHLLTRIGLTGRQYSYPEDGRFAVIDKTRVPPILRIALPKIVPDPDRLFDQLAVKVPQFPTQTVGLHHRMMLDLVAEIEGRRRWVERTGASSMVAYPWLSANPDAKVVYLTRNTADTALSMSKHPVFQLTAIRNQFHQRYGADPYVRALERSLPAELPEEMRRLLPENLTAQTLRELDYDLSFYETTIAQMNGSAEQALADLRPRELLRVRYEDILADPVPELAKIGEFLGFADPSGWATQVSDQVNPPKKRSAAPA
jgi:pimeloyl-ACP methyl ester carboxylesterase/acyl carrier protein